MTDVATATVALKPADALKLAAESQEGTLYLVLRPFKPRDMYTFDTDYAGVPQGNGQAASSSSAPSAPQPAPAPSYSAPQPAPSNAGGYSAPSSSSSGDSASSMPVLGRTIEVIRGVTSTREGVQ